MMLKKNQPITAVSRNCWFLFLRVHEKRLSLTENNPFAGIVTVTKPQNVSGNILNPMTHRKYSESKFYITPQILIVIGLMLTTFWPTSIYLYGIPVITYGVGAILIWTTQKKLMVKVLWTLVPIIVVLIIFKNYIQ